MTIATTVTPEVELRTTARGAQYLYCTACERAMPGTTGTCTHLHAARRVCRGMRFDSVHVRTALDRIAQSPVPCQRLNPGVVALLLRTNRARLVELPSPYPSARGALIQHLTVPA